nr:MAG TPA: hypothetical protein [Caudoviricetes sp.]
MGELATHPAWDAISKLEEWFDNKNVGIRTTEAGSVCVSLPLLRARIEFLSDGSAQVRYRDQDGGERSFMWENATQMRPLASLLGGLAGCQESPPLFVQQVREEVMHSVGMLPIILPAARDGARESCDLLFLIGTKAVRITIITRPDGSHGGKIQRGRWPHAMTIHFPTLSCGAVRQALEVINV